MEVIKVWEKYKPQLEEVHLRNRVIRFVNDSIDFLSKAKRPALSPCWLKAGFKSPSSWISANLARLLDEAEHDLRRDSVDGLSRT